jgi:hypothetical protein
MKRFSTPNSGRLIIYIFRSIPYLNVTSQPAINSHDNHAYNPAPAPELYFSGAELMPHCAEEKPVVKTVVLLPPSLHEYMRTRARAEDRPLSAEVRHVLMDLYRAHLREAGLAKELIG